jgi:DNA-binding PadR family transcriptional regulator
MAGEQLTSFEQILLGLICLSPASGYDLKRIFATTPMGLYQPSSGTLYPALRRLEARGLVRAKALDGASESARHRRVYEATQTGLTAHMTWLRAPIERATVSRDLGLHLMRFVMMEHMLSRDEVLEFLHNLEDSLAELTTELERYAAAYHPSQLHPRLALDHGLAVHRTSLRWAERTIAAVAAQSLRAGAKSPVGAARGGASRGSFRRMSRDPARGRWPPGPAHQARHTGRFRERPWPPTLPIRAGCR